MQNQATEITSSWEINIRAPYKQILASDNEKEKQKILRGFIARTKKLFERKIVNLEDFENLDDLICFVEQLLIVLNESQTLLQSELPGFDETILPILEKYASLLVYQSSHSHSQEACMKKLVTFLSSLPVHHRSKLSPQARVKKIVTLLLDATQTESSGQCEKKKKRETKPKDLSQNGINEILFIVNQPEDSPVSHAKFPTSHDSKRGSPLSKEEAGKKEKNDKSPTVTNKTTVATQEQPITVFNSNSKEDTQTQALVADDSGDSIAENCVITEAFSESEAKCDTDVIIPLSDTKLPARHTDLRQLQKMLRNRFPVPWNITPSEKYLLRRLLLLLKSKRPVQSPVWKISKLNVYKCDKLPRRESPVEPEDTRQPIPNAFSKLSQDSKTNCDRSTSPVSAQSALTPEKSSSSGQEESFLSCITPHQNSIDDETCTQKEDPFDKVKNLNVSKTAESELTMSDVELLEEMEITIRRLEKEREEETSDKSADLLNDPLLCTSSLLENLPLSSSIDEHKLEKSSRTRSLDAKEKSSPTPSSSERRRSSRLAGLPALPLIFTQQPLPSKRKSSTPCSTSKPSSRRDDNLEEESEAKQLEAIKEDSACESASKKPRYSDRLSLDLNLTPNLPKKPVRRRIVSSSLDPYFFVASDEEQVENKANTDLKQSEENKSSKRDSSKALLSPDVVELSPCSDMDMEVVFSQVKTGGKANKNSKNESTDMMPITPESEAGSYRPSSRLKLSVVNDEKSNDSVEVISVANNNTADKSQLDQTGTLSGLSKITWQEIRQLLPVCWADILEQHVKSRHADEVLLCQKPDGTTSNIPTVYCCAVPEP